MSFGVAGQCHVLSTSASESRPHLLLMMMSCAPSCRNSPKIPTDLYRSLREIYAPGCIMLSTSEPLLFTCRMKRWIFLRLFMLYLTLKSSINKRVQPLKSSFRFLPWPPWIPTQKTTLPCESTLLPQPFIDFRFQRFDTNFDRKFTTLFSKEMVEVT